MRLLISTVVSCWQNDKGKWYGFLEKMPGMEKNVYFDPRACRLPVFDDFGEVYLPEILGKRHISSPEPGAQVVFRLEQGPRGPKASRWCFADQFFSLARKIAEGKVTRYRAVYPNGGNRLVSVWQGFCPNGKNARAALKNYPQARLQFDNGHDWKDLPSNTGKKPETRPEKATPAPAIA
ncbi:MAG: hypothetical protein UX19_C0006G0014 [Candidatus Woesebacteria bacterium GW2011_GWA1_45_8]|uniref:Uncharacterized protein n=1 Tax=Candidatus Woesebacteria bacterium GW2011_GWA1_45_8 TaxID=1618559 RepID=A0A0G1Q370_9BACT|nr:MAG: hypothetical protein UX19_C0006G0014 [Candidatus Woesebacteria bacterium GW2011_GWA1_45_8]